jgi:hypothetical protein
LNTAHLICKRPNLIAKVVEQCAITRHSLDDLLAEPLSTFRVDHGEPFSPKLKQRWPYNTIAFAEPIILADTLSDLIVLEGIRMALQEPVSGSSSCWLRAQATFPYGS